MVLKGKIKKRMSRTTNIEEKENVPYLSLNPFLDELIDKKLEEDLQS